MWPIRGTDIPHAFIPYMFDATVYASIPHTALCIHFVLSPPTIVIKQCALTAHTMQTLCYTHLPTFTVVITLWVSITHIFKFHTIGRRRTHSKAVGQLMCYSHTHGHEIIIVCASIPHTVYHICK